MESIVKISKQEQAQIEFKRVIILLLDMDFEKKDIKQFTKEAYRKYKELRGSPFEKPEVRC